MNVLMNADDISKELGISKSRAYQMIRQYNKELQKDGYFTMPGRLPREYLSTKIFGGIKEYDKQ